MQKLKTLFLFILLSAIGLLLMTACNSGGESSTGPENEFGTLRVDITTTGQSFDKNGYTLSLDDSNTKQSEVVDVVFFGNLEPGIHRLSLNDIQGNCSVLGENSQISNVMMADTVTVMFDVNCEKRLENQVVFMSNRSGGDNNFELYVMNADGSDPTPLTRNGFINLYPSVSPDGTRVLYTHRITFDDLSFHLRVINADGTNDVVLTAPGGQNILASWSPDGSKIVFTSLRDGNAEIYTMDADGSNPVNISRSDSVDQTSSWSPDGSKIAFSSNRDGDYEIYVSNTDGTGLVQITNDPGIDVFPTWSPDGSQIAFTSTRAENANIFVMNADGTGIIQLTNSEGNVNPTWSPDGTEIAFTRNQNGNSDIFKIRIDGSGFPVNLTAHQADEDTPAWSPVPE